MIRFKEYLILEAELRENLSGMFKNLELWFDLPHAFDRRVARLTELMNYAGGPAKFAMVVRRLPAVAHFMRKHRDDFEGELRDAADKVL